MQPRRIYFSRKFTTTPAWPISTGIWPSQTRRYTLADSDLYQAQGRYADAEPLYKRFLAIKEKALGPDHSSTATSLNNRAWLYKDTGDKTSSLFVKN
jgi:hypothetical protein